ncbi:mitochondrial intermediate peptidase [Elsinoe australis]|uniref:Mitochondrial intermediate peptidase n=1 Tax=Elsinoe australis TaxID=40998 RepID=A0A4U7B1L4_9PEZI|nr:mitochondrial intermediate peptidase [Elsinoe australis]
MKRLVRSSWICPTCQVHQARHVSKRTITTAAATASIPKSFFPPTYASPATSQDDDILRQIFDSSAAWKDFAARSQTLNNGQPAGLFRNRYLHKPEGFEKYAAWTLQKCKKLVSQIASYESVEQYQRIVKDLDRLSDLLCRVIDLCEFVRSTHPDRAIQTAATKAYLMMFQYMNVLNTTPVLHTQLQKALSLPEVTRVWSEQERVVANILARDFSKSAIDLPDGDRQSFVEISDTVSQLGSQFMDEMEAAKPVLEFPSSKLKGMDPMVVRQLTRWGSVSLPTAGMPANLALRSVEDPDVRREVYMANRTASKETVGGLERMLELRAQLAKLSGFDSFGHMTLADKMAKTPEAVNKFLNALHDQNVPQSKAELQDLLEIKRSDARANNFPNEINAWDRDYYSAKLLSSLEYRARNDHLSSYFSLGTVMQGLSRLFQRLYGIRLVPQETQPGETWNPDVRRLDVVDDTEGHIAVIYCDLFQRAGKSPNPAHFTVRCSREISQEEQIEARHMAASEPNLFPTTAEAANDGLSVGVRKTGEGQALFQLPTIALICDFAFQQASRTTSSRPALLSFREIQTLFHEMGHALHSICGRTTLQNVSGTRCATDFAELPSVLMEHFASAPEVLGLFARHWETGAPLDPSLVRERVDVEKRMQGAEVEGQILMSLLDQSYHSPEVIQAGSRFDSTRGYHDIWNKYSSVPEPAGTTWQGFFGHLVGYGATYYAYLFDRVIAGKIWRDVFQRRQGGAIDEKAGRLFREEVLKWGGGRDGWHCIAGALKDRDGILAEGKDGAMEIVGQWGLKD